jgi:hypothetical protein
MPDVAGLSPGSALLPGISRAHFPGIPGLFAFPFPRKNSRESQEIKYVSFYWIGTSNFYVFSIMHLFTSIFHDDSKNDANISYTHISNEFESTHFTKYKLGNLDSYTSIDST